MHVVPGKAYAIPTILSGAVSIPVQLHQVAKAPTRLSTTTVTRQLRRPERENEKNHQEYPCSPAVLFLDKSTIARLIPPSVNPSDASLPSTSPSPAANLPGNP